jgi:hypothetical protein
MPTVNLDTSARLDIICRRADTFVLTVDFNTALTSYPAANWKLQVRDSDTDDSGTGLIQVSGAGSHPLTSGFGVDSESLQIIINSTDMDVDSGLYVYDLQTDSSGAIRTWLHGEFKIIEDVTI